MEMFKDYNYNDIKLNLNYFDKTITKNPTDESLCFIKIKKANC